MEKPAIGRAEEMGVKCANCGEELLGAVNRCWRCGTRIESHPGDIALPPVRRAPIPPQVEIAAAIVAEEDATDDPADSNAVVEAALADGTTAETPASDKASGEIDANPPVVARRVGSPFADPAAASDDGSAERLQPPKTHFVVRQANYPRHVASAGGSIAALVLGILSLIASFYTVGAVVTALIGLLMGIWGLYSTRRGPAIIGILLCCIAMAIGGFNGVVWVYESQYGYRPWDAPSEYDTLDEGFEEGMDNF